MLVKIEDEWYNPLHVRAVYKTNDYNPSTIIDMGNGDIFLIAKMSVDEVAKKIDEGLEGM